MVILLRRLARSAVLLAALLLSCAVALLLVMRGPLSRVALATTDNQPLMLPVLPTIGGDLSKLYIVESVLLKNWSRDKMQNIKVPELKGKTLLRSGAAVPHDYTVASRSDSQDFRIDRLNVFVDEDNVITKAYWG